MKKAALSLFVLLSFSTFAQKPMFQLFVEEGSVTDVIAVYFYETNTDDSSGNENDATNQGVEFNTSNPMQGSYDGTFSGIDELITPDLGSFSTGISIHTMYYYSAAGATHTIFDAGGLRLYGSSADDYFHLVTVNGNDSTELVSGDAFDPSGNHSVTVTTDGDTAYVYDDGNLLTMTGTITAGFEVDPVIYFGNAKWLTAPLTGYLDNTHIINTMIPADSVSALHNTPGYILKY